MIRPRKPPYSDFPPNLSFDKTNGVYRYHNPLTRKITSIGRHRGKAIAAAKQLNSILMEGQDLVSKVIGSGKPLSQFVDERFIPHILPERKLATSTERDYQYKLIVIKEKLGKMPVCAITVKDIADFLNEFPPTNANHYRSLLSLIFKYAIAEGLTTLNPAMHTIKRSLVKKRRRLKKEWFDVIHENAPLFLQNAMDIALLSLQRRGDVVKMKFTDQKVEPEGEFLYVVQSKTEKHGEKAFLKIPIGKELKKVIARCKDDVLSPYLVHRRSNKLKRIPNRPHPTFVRGAYLAKTFAAIRDKLPCMADIPREERPTFHEIRALGIKLYKDAGYDSKLLAGHFTDEMHELYLKGHETKWTKTGTTF